MDEPEGGAGELVFLQPLTPVHNTSMKGDPKAPAKLFHKKSRTGCLRCRTRRVKCDESKPACRHCCRHQLPCVYDRNLASTAMAGVSLNPLPSPSESPNRRRTELQLLHQYMSSTGRSLALDGASQGVFSSMIPSYSFKSTALQYSMHSIAALHLGRTAGASEHEHLPPDLHHRYLHMALRENSRELAHLTTSSIDQVCLTSNLIRLIALITLQDRETQPYTPPVDWLRMTYSTRAVITKAASMLGVNGDTGAAQLIKSSPDILNWYLCDAKDGSQVLSHLLRQETPRDDAEPWNEEIEAAYKSTLSYICSVVLTPAAKGAVTSSETCRRLVVFPLLVHKRFIDLVEQKQPRALAILAHYFILLSQYGRDLWWIGDVGFKEASAIRAALPSEWQAVVAVPAQAEVDSKINRWRQEHQGGKRRFDAIGLDFRG